MESKKNQKRNSGAGAKLSMAKADRIESKNKKSETVKNGKKKENDQYNRRYAHHADLCYMKNDQSSYKFAIVYISHICIVQGGIEMGEKEF